MKFVHAADLHLDSPLGGLSRYPGAPVARMRGATRAALDNLVSFCIAERAELLVIAGDLYDGDWRDYSTGLYFASQMARLREGKVDVVWIRGNHDAASQITRHLRLPENVHELPCNEAATRCFERHGLAVHGRGFATRAVTENLAQSYPERVPGLVNIGLLHTSFTGRPGHEPYAPCKLEGLRAKGYDYWALGHVHAREVLSEDPWVVFPGNLQGRHARETGAKGATLVSYDAGGIRSVVHEPLDVVRYAELRVDLDGVRGFEEALDRVRMQLTRAAEDSDGRTIAARIQLHGRTPAHARLQSDVQAFVESVRASAIELGGEDLWVEKVIFQTQGSREATAGGRSAYGALAELGAALGALREDDAALRALAEPKLGQLAAKLPSEVRDGSDGLRIDDPRFLRAQLDEIEAMLFERLLPSAEGS